MNFFAHATLALWRSDNPRFVLGSMLPDLAGMIGVRVQQIDDPELASGVAFHHATDAAFHHAPLFLQLCDEGITTLTAAGVARGTARAVSHVGTELLLDGTLSHDACARVAYRRALDTAVSERFVDDLGLAHPEHVQRFHSALGRLAQAPVPEGYRDLTFVMARLRATLARRPRLAIQDDAVSQVEQLLAAYQPRVERSWPVLREQVRAQLLADSVPVQSAT